MCCTEFLNNCSRLGNQMRLFTRISRLGRYGGERSQIQVVDLSLQRALFIIDCLGQNFESSCLKFQLFIISCLCELLAPSAFLSLVS